ncbi:MAG: sigma-70 family RNA polymerase sigma factor [Pirellulales bacterium]|nr:sigma-70 family RNA polymerase sigma factor [Pirellulales bacterium]
MISTCSDAPGAQLRDQAPARAARSQGRKSRHDHELQCRRAARLRDLKIEFVAGPFDRPGDAERIESLLPPNGTNQSASCGATTPRPAGTRGYFASLYETPLLAPDEERSLFRRLNFVKSRAADLCATLDPDKPDVPLMDDIELLLAEADRVRNHIWRANLRLVVSIAKRYVNAENSLPDLISDGNMSLLRAIECFDVSRGYRFSTYATWAIRKNFHRAITRLHRDRARFLSVDESLLATNPDRVTPIVSTQHADAVRQSLAQLLEQLPDRERLVVSARFGFDAGEHPQTLQQIAERLGVCKERSRQLLLRALARLKTLAVETGLESLET